MIAPAIDPEQFLQLMDNRKLIDVRAPIEYKKGHIPGAVNIPLFEDEERSEIGTLYKMRGKEEAVMRGLEIVSPKMADFVRSAKAVSPHNKVLVYCFRGGMRSNSFAWLLRTAGLDAHILQGGYKAYRHHVLQHFERPYPLVLIGGATGSGKTDVLNHLIRSGTQGIDLEGLAHHKGSAFGALVEGSQDPQQLFEHHLFNGLRGMDLTRPLLLEDESMTIGYNKIPYPLWQQMKRAPILQLEIPYTLRLKRLVNEYGNLPVEHLKRCIQKIQSQLGPQHAKRCLELLDVGQTTEAAAITLDYYDRAYTFNHEKKEHNNTILTLRSDTDDPVQNAAKLQAALESPELKALISL